MELKENIINNPIARRYINHLRRKLAIFRKAIGIWSMSQGIFTTKRIYGFIIKILVLKTFPVILSGKFWYSREYPMSL